MKIFDCFLFNDELDILEHRLTVLGDIVSTFVIVEATTTFQGRNKPLHFADSRVRYERWRHQIRHVVVELTDADSPWDREEEQHRAFGANLGDAASDDLVLVGDCDEVPFRKAIDELAATRRPPTRLHMRYAVYWANTVRAQSWTDGTMAFRWHDRDDPSLGTLLGREGATWGTITDPAAVADGGWHLSDLGDVAWITRKLSSFSHTELLAPSYSAAQHLKRCRGLGVDYQTGELLTLVPQLPLELEGLATIASWAVRRDTFPPPPIRLVYGAFSASRRRLPPRLVAWADAHIILFLATFGVPLVIAQRAARPLWRAFRHRRVR